MKGERRQQLASGDRADNSEKGARQKAIHSFLPEAVSLVAGRGLLKLVYPHIRPAQGIQ